MSKEQYASLPADLTVREVRVVVRQKGFRTKALVIVTTLLDAEQYPAEELAILYRRRWQAELHRLKTPEFATSSTCTLAYNLIRQLLAAAGTEQTGTVVGEFQGPCDLQPSPPLQAFYRELGQAADAIATIRRQRPNRFESRKTPP
jgi:hypothetical protein